MYMIFPIYSLPKKEMSPLHEICLVIFDNMLQTLKKSKTDTKYVVQYFYCFL